MSHNKVYVLIRDCRSPGFQATYGAQALANFSRRWLDYRFLDTILLSVPRDTLPPGITKKKYGISFQDWEDIFDQHNLKHSIAVHWCKRSPDLIRMALAVEGAAEPLVKDLSLFLKQYRSKFDGY